MLLLFRKCFGKRGYSSIDDWILNERKFHNFMVTPLMNFPRTSPESSFVVAVVVWWCLYSASKFGHEHPSTADRFWMCGIIGRFMSNIQVYWYTIPSIRPLCSKKIAIDRCEKVQMMECARKKIRWKVGKKNNHQLLRFAAKMISSSSNNNNSSIHRQNVIKIIFHAFHRYCCTWLVLLIRFPKFPGNWPGLIECTTSPIHIGLLIRNFN